MSDLNVYGVCSYVGDSEEDGKIKEGFGSWKPKFKFDPLSSTMQWDVWDNDLPSSETQCIENKLG